MMSKKIVSIFLLCCMLALTLVACGNSGPGNAAGPGNSSPDGGSGNTVHMNNTHFLQSSITIHKGESITLVADTGVPTLYGDAANSDMLSHVRLKQARAVVVTLPDEAAAAMVVATARAEAPHVPIIVRAARPEGVGQ